MVGPESAAGSPFAAQVRAAAECSNPEQFQPKQRVGAFPQQDWHLGRDCKECDLLRIDDSKGKKKYANIKQLVLFPLGSGMCVFAFAEFQKVCRH